MKKNILLTGASGTVGFEVLKQLLEKDCYHISVFDIESNDSKRKFAKLKQNFEIIYGNISQLYDVEKVTKNKDVVIHLAAIIPPLADENPDLAYRVNVLGTQNLVESLEKNSPNSFFVYSSSISVYGDRLQNPNIKVTDSLLPSQGDEYAVTKIEAERLIQNSALDWSIFRLAAIMGNHKISKLMFHMPLDTHVEICTPEDTARAFVHAIDKKEQLNKKIFNLGGGAECRITYRELLTKSFDLFGLGKLDFPEKSFAEKNFHCGNYVDGDILEDILHFRQDDLDDYFEKVKKGVNPIVKGLTEVVKPLVKKRLMKVSEPYEAYIKKDKVLMERFFN